MHPPVFGIRAVTFFLVNIGNSFRMYQSKKIFNIIDRCPAHLRMNLAKKKIIKILDESRPEKAIKMVANIEKVIGNVYEDKI